MKKHIVPAAKSETNTRHIRIKTKETQEDEQKKKQSKWRNVYWTPS